MANYKTPYYSGVSLNTGGNPRRSEDVCFMGQTRGRDASFERPNTSRTTPHSVNENNYPSPSPRQRSETTQNRQLRANFLDPSRASEIGRNSVNFNKPCSKHSAVSNNQLSSTRNTTAANTTRGNFNISSRVSSRQNQPCRADHSQSQGYSSDEGKFFDFQSKKLNDYSGRRSTDDVSSTGSVSSFIYLYESLNNGGVTSNTHGGVQNGCSETPVPGQSAKKNKLHTLASKAFKTVKKTFSSTSKSRHVDKSHTVPRGPPEAGAFDVSSTNTPDSTFGFGTAPSRALLTRNPDALEGNTSQTHISPHASETNMNATCSVPYHSKHQGHFNFTETTRRENFHSATSAPRESPMAKHNIPKHGSGSLNPNGNAARVETVHVTSRTRDKIPSIERSQTPNNVPPFEKNKPSQTHHPMLDTTQRSQLNLIYPSHRVSWTEDNFPPKVRDHNDGSHCSRSTSVTSLISFFEQDKTNRPTQERFSNGKSGYRQAIHSKSTPSLQSGTRHQNFNSRLEPGLAVQPKNQFQSESSISEYKPPFVHTCSSDLALPTQATPNDTYEPRQRGIYERNSKANHGPDSGRNSASKLPSFSPVSPTQAVVQDKTRCDRFIPSPEEFAPQKQTMRTGHGQVQCDPRVMQASCQSGLIKSHRHCLSCNKLASGLTGSEVEYSSDDSGIQIMNRSNYHPDLENQLRHLRSKTERANNQARIKSHRDCSQCAEMTSQYGHENIQRGLPKDGSNERLAVPSHTSASVQSKGKHQKLTETTTCGKCIHSTFNSPHEPPRAKHERPYGNVSLNPEGNATLSSSVYSMQRTDGSVSSLERSPTVRNASSPFNQNRPTFSQYQSTTQQKQLQEGGLKERSEASEHRQRPDSKPVAGDSMTFGLGLCISGSRSSTPTADIKTDFSKTNSGDFIQQHHSLRTTDRSEPQDSQRGLDPPSRPNQSIPYMSDLAAQNSRPHSRSESKGMSGSPTSRSGKKQNQMNQQHRGQAQFNKKVLHSSIGPHLPTGDRHSWPKDDSGQRKSIAQLIDCFEHPGSMSTPDRATKQTEQTRIRANNPHAAGSEGKLFVQSKAQRQSSNVMSELDARHQGRPYLSSQSDGGSYAPDRASETRRNSRNYNIPDLHPSPVSSKQANIIDNNDASVTSGQIDNTRPTEFTQQNQSRRTDHTEPRVDLRGLNPPSGIKAMTDNQFSQSNNAFGSLVTRRDHCFNSNASDADQCAPIHQHSNAQECSGQTTGNMYTWVQERPLDSRPKGTQAVHSETTDRNEVHSPFSQVLSELNAYKKHQAQSRPHRGETSQTATYGLSESRPFETSSRSNKAIGFEVQPNRNQPTRNSQYCINDLGQRNENNDASNSAVYNATHRPKRDRTREVYSPSYDPGISEPPGGARFRPTSMTNSVPQEAPVANSTSSFGKDFNGQRNTEANVSSVPVKNTSPQQPSKSTDGKNTIPPSNTNFQNKSFTRKPAGSVNSADTSFSASYSASDGERASQISFEELLQTIATLQQGNPSINFNQFFLQPVANDNRKNIHMKKAGNVAVNGPMTCNGRYDDGCEIEETDSSNSSDANEDDVRTTSV